MHRIEGAAAATALRLIRALGPARASTLCGAVARGIGPLLPVSRIAHINLRMALPELDAAARETVVRGVWENLGRTIGEFAHLGALRPTDAGPGWQVAGAEHVLALRDKGGPAIMFTGHISNWEIVPVVTAHLGVRGAPMYRPASNKRVDELVQALRREAVGADAPMFAKGAGGARQALAHLRAGGLLGILPDQKMNDGIEVRFFGLPAMTASALAALALKLSCPVLPVHVQRLAPARLLVTFEPPLALPASGSRLDDIAQLTQAVNDRMETWIRARPESWLWLHRRWAKPLYRRAVDGKG